MSNKINTKCRDCKYCSPPSIIDETPKLVFEPKSIYESRTIYVGAPKRKIVYRCEAGMNHTTIKSKIMIIDDDSHYNCIRFSRK